MKITIALLVAASICSAEYAINPQPAANGVVITSMRMEFVPRLWTTVKYCPIVTTSSVVVTSNDVTDILFPEVTTNSSTNVTFVTRTIVSTSTTYHTVYTYPEIAANLDSKQSEALSKLTNQQLGIGTDPVPFAATLDAVIKAGMKSIGMPVNDGTLR